jgi:hypothetical protein
MGTMSVQAAIAASQSLNRYGPLYAIALFVMMYAGVIGPIIWSRKPSRQRAAYAVLDRILDSVNRLLELLTSRRA